MRSRITTGLLAGATALGLGQPAGANSDVAAAVVAGVVGAAIGASLADHPHHKHGHKAHFSPEAGIECYDYQRACYHADGGFAKNWTWRVYG